MGRYCCIVNKANWVSVFFSFNSQIGDRGQRGVGLHRDTLAPSRCRRMRPRPESGSAAWYRRAIKLKLLSGETVYTCITASLLTP
uniref:Uncharacterized protein n=1 Tax=Anguilla anguilla TaxID=7936 RepID=A0A0E9QRZ1_ANGAN